MDRKGQNSGLPDRMIRAMDNSMYATQVNFLSLVHSDHLFNAVLILMVNFTGHLAHLEELSCNIDSFLESQSLLGVTMKWTNVTKSMVRRFCTQHIPLDLCFDLESHSPCFTLIVVIAFYLSPQ